MAYERLFRQLLNTLHRRCAVGAEGMLTFGQDLERVKKEGVVKG